LTDIYENKIHQIYFHLDLVTPNFTEILSIVSEMYIPTSRNELGIMCPVYAFRASTLNGRL